MKALVLGNKQIKGGNRISDSWMCHLQKVHYSQMLSPELKWREISIWITISSASPALIFSLGLFESSPRSFLMRSSMQSILIHVQFLTILDLILMICSSLLALLHLCEKDEDSFLKMRLWTLLWVIGIAFCIFTWVNQVVCLLIWNCARFFCKQTLLFTWDKQKVKKMPQSWQVSKHTPPKLTIWLMRHEMKICDVSLCQLSLNKIDDTREKKLKNRHLKILLCVFADKFKSA